MICSFDIFRLDRADIIADRWFLYDFAEIHGISGKLYFQRPCHNCFCLRRIWAGVAVTVAFVNFFCIFPVHALACRRKNHQPCADSRRYVIDDIVQLCRTPSKIQIFVIFVSHHGIHGIDGLIQKAQCRSAEGKKEERCNDTVRRILRDRFHGSFRHSCFRKIFRITSYDHGNRIARPRKIVFF